MENIKLFCFPYAGGTCSMYREWTKVLKDCIKLFPIEFAGRGSRFGVPLYTSMDEVIEDIYTLIEREVDEGAYAFYGHSMGSIIAYELYFKILSCGKTLPRHIFFSGNCPPHIETNNRLHMLSDDEFLKKLNDFGGTPEEFFNSKELVNIFLPIIKADFKVCETYRHKSRPILECDISIFNGKDDIESKDISKWSMYTTKECTFHEFSGGHFFINEHQNEIVNIINETLIL